MFLSLSVRYNIDNIFLTKVKICLFITPNRSSFSVEHTSTAIIGCGFFSKEFYSSLYVNIPFIVFFLENFYLVFFDESFELNNIHQINIINNMKIAQ